MSFSGSCLCGKFRYQIDRKHLNAMHCYCAMCRKAHGTAFSTHVIVKPEQLRWTAGDSLRRFESSPGAFREFCPECGTHLLVHGQSGDGTLAVPAGTLDGKPPLTIIGHMFTEELVPWYAIVDDLPQHERWPPGFGPVDALFVYGTLQPGGANEHVLAGLDGTWAAASVRGRLLDEGWGASLGCPGIVLDESGHEVSGSIFRSAGLSAQWGALDEFEGAEYERIATGVTLENGQAVTAYIYCLKSAG